MTGQARALTVVQADEIRRLHGTGSRRREIADLVGVTVRTVNEVLMGKRGGRPLTARQQADLDRANGWAPACMDAPEWEHWQALNPLAGLTDGAMASRPCNDCPLGYAADMRAQGRCNGEPGGVADDLDETEQEDPPMEPQAATRPEHGRRTPIAVDAPCGRCVKADVCPMRATIEAPEVTVMLAPLDRRLTLVLSGEVRCTAFVKAPGAKARAAAVTSSSGRGLTARQQQILDAVTAAAGDRRAAAEALGVIPQLVDSTLAAIAGKGRIPAELLAQLHDRFAKAQETAA